MAKILLVEDNEFNRDMLSRRLRRRGHDVKIAVNGAEAIEIAITYPFDLILMDMSLPVVDGWEATQQLKVSPKTTHIPIIALTAHAMVGDREKALAVGCDEYDTKPIELKRLLGKIQALLPKEISPIQSTPVVHQGNAPSSLPKADSTVLSDRFRSGTRLGSTPHRSGTSIASPAYPPLIQERYAIQSLLYEDFWGPVVTAIDQLTGATILLQSIQIEAEDLCQQVRIALNLEGEQLRCLEPSLLKVHYHQIDQAFYIIHELGLGYTGDRLLTHLLSRSQSWPLNSVLGLMDDLLQQLFPFHQANQFHGGLRAECFSQQSDLAQSLNGIRLIDSGLRARMIMNLAQQVTRFRKQLIQQRDYSPPEQRIGEPMLSSDLYALGLIGLQALTGLRSKDLVTVSGPLAWQKYLRQSSVPESLLDWFEKMVSLNHIERYEHAMAAHKSLQPYLRLSSEASQPISYSAGQSACDNE